MSVHAAGFEDSPARWRDLEEQEASAEYDFYYDFDVDGGAVGTIPLRGDNEIPENFVIVAAFLSLQTGLDSADSTATAAVTSGETAGDLKAATQVNNAFWTTAATINGLTIKKVMSADRTPSLVVAVQALTQGKFWLHIDGFMSP